MKTDITFLKRHFFQRILGWPRTPKPADPDCWRFSDGELTIDLKKAPELREEGGAIRLEGASLPRRVLVVSERGGRFHAFHNRCTHLGHRRLDPVFGTGTVQCCSVGKSTYDLNGKNLYGPAPQPITVFPVRADGDQLTIIIE